MRVVLFFAYLCFFLLGADKYVMATTHHNSISNSPAKHITHQQQVKSTATDQDYPIITASGPDNEEEYLVSDDVEEEDASNFFVRKYKLMARCDLAPYPFTLPYLCKYFKAPPLFWGHLSSIYITQRVLRI